LECGGGAASAQLVVLLTLFVAGTLFDQPALADGEEEVTCGICLGDIEAGITVRQGGRIAV
jgi:hypothetical protein